MNRLIIPDVQPDLLDLESYDRRVEEICTQLQAENPDWIRLDKDTLLDAADNPGKYKGKTFIIPGALVSSRRHMTNVNRLVAFMFWTQRHFGLDFAVVAPSLKAVDLRIRDQIDWIENWVTKISDEHGASKASRVEDA